MRLTSELREQGKAVRRAFEYVYPYRGRLLIGLALSAVLTGLNGVATYSLLPVFRIVFQISGAGSEAIEKDADWMAQAVNWFNAVLIQVAGEGDLTAQVLRLTSFIVALTLTSTVLSLIADYQFISTQALGVRALRAKVYYHLSRLPMHFYAQSRTGELISRVQNDLGGTIGLVVRNLANGITGMISAVVFFFLLLLLSPALVLVIIPVLALVVLVMVVLGRWMKRNRKRFLAWQAVMTVVIHEFFSGIRVVKMFGAEEKERRRWWEKIDTSRRYEIVNNLNKILPLRLAEVLAVGVSAAVLVVGAKFIVADSLEVSELLVFFVVLAQFLRPVNLLSRTWIGLQHGLADAQRTFQLLDTPVEGSRGMLKRTELKRELVFDNISFRYGATLPWVLREVSFSLPKGQTVALVGMSGSGKSTLIDLLLRLYEVTEGAVRLDGVEIGELAVAEYRQLFGVVTQDTFLFNDTVKNNIAYSVGGEVEDEAIVAAARVAHAHDFIELLPEGYDTVLGERGVRLSAGQRQRVALARAVVRNPAVLVLDEATSALDSESERLVQVAIDELARERTTLVIAHRLSTIVGADQIVVIHEGRVVQLGNHQELSEQDGLYRHLWQLQTM